MKKLEAVLKQYALVWFIVLMVAIMIACVNGVNSTCIGNVYADADKSTSVSISVAHCSSGTVLPLPEGITVTNGKMDVIKLVQKGKEDVYLSPQSSTYLPNGEISWKVIE